MLNRFDKQISKKIRALALAEIYKQISKKTPILFRKTDLRVSRHITGLSQHMPEQCSMTRDVYDLEDKSTYCKRDWTDLFIYYLSLHFT